MLLLLNKYIDLSNLIELGLIEFKKKIKTGIYLCL